MKSKGVSNRSPGLIQDGDLPFFLWKSFTVGTQLRLRKNRVTERLSLSQDSHEWTILHELHCLSLSPFSLPPSCPSPEVGADWSDNVGGCKHDKYQYNLSEDVFSKFSFKNFFGSMCFGVWHSGQSIEETLPFEWDNLNNLERRGQGPDSNHAGLFWAHEYLFWKDI